jgi:hypothetical protein
MIRPTFTHLRHTALATWALGLLCMAPTSQAGEVYTGAGFPGLMLGYAQAVSDLVTLRADVATLGSRSKNGNQEGINYQGKLKSTRLGVFADYFPTGSDFRLTGGLTFNQMKVDLKSNFQAGQVVTIGNTTVVVPGSGYRFNVNIKMPAVTPYLGLGWGHKDVAQGWGFVADLGASIGQAKVDIDTNITDAGVSQADIDRETQELKDGVGKIRLIPQASIGLSYRY